MGCKESSDWPIFESMVSGLVSGVPERTVYFGKYQVKSKVSIPIPPLCEWLGIRISVLKHEIRGYFMDTLNVNKISIYFFYFFYFFFYVTQLHKQGMSRVLSVDTIIKGI